jgi:hypothetical protein
MLMAQAWRRVAALRQPGASARLARALWLVWAIIVWNVVFDHIIVSAGRKYIVAAERAAAVPGAGRPGRPFANMDDWMRPAVTRGLWVASASAGAIVIAGLLLVSAVRAGHPDRQPPCA